MIKLCKYCNIEKYITEFVKTSKGKFYKCKKCHKDYMFKYIQIHKNYLKNNNLKSRYKINIDTYNAMFKKQDGKCAICDNLETHVVKSGIVRDLSVDHCHETGNIRQLLCNNCNRGLGNFKDKIQVIKKAIEYLEKHKSGAV